MLNPIIKVKWRIFLHHLEEIKQAPFLRTIILLFFISGIVYLCYAFAHYMFELLSGIEGAGSFLCDKLLNLFFMSLFFLLVFSNAISSYSTIFRSQEIHFLLGYPFSYNEIFGFKFFESMFLTSWAFFLLIAPFIYAYLKAKGVALFYLPLAFLFTFPYILITSVFGTLFTLILVRFLPRRDLRPYLILALAFLILASVIYLRHKYFQRETASRGEILFFISQLIPYFNLAEKPYLPSYWLSKSINLISGGMDREVWFYFWLLSINAIFFSQVIFKLVPFIYYTSITSLSSSYNIGVKVRRWFWNLLKKIFIFLTPSERELALKDIKSIIRDPLQYFQLLVFFGILGVYFTNLQGEYYQSFPMKWKIFISFLNLTATNLVLASLGIRFVYPLISLEGRRMWILNLSLLSRSRILFSKFLTISIFALLINLSLITVSNFMLRVDKEFIKISTFGSIISAFTLIGIIIGLGAWFPNFKEDNPSRIIAGLGGTLGLIISLIYVGIMVVLLALPFEFYILGKMPYPQLKFYNKISILVLFLISFSLVSIHLYKGKKSLEKAEF